MSKYFDKTFFINPLFNYLRWFKCKSFYQLKYWGKHLRINYRCLVKNSEFGKYNWLGNNSQITNSQMGDFTYCSYDCAINNAEIGKFCAIGPNVKIAPGKHPTSGYVSLHPSLYSNQSIFVKNFVTENIFKGAEQVKIGNDVWIGANCVIIDGVTIGDGAIIAANSVVNKDVADYEIVGGVPAKYIRKRFDDKEIEFLLKTQWWDKSEDWIQHNIEKFWSIDEFVNL